MTNEELEQRVFELVNAERTSRGITPLIWSDVFARAARIHSQDMAVNNFLAHTSSNGAGSFLILNRIPGNEVYRWMSNSGSSSRTPEGAVTGWMNSTAGHREAIIDPSCTHVGIGFYAYEGRVRWYKFFGTLR